LQLLTERKGNCLTVCQRAHTYAQALTRIQKDLQRLFVVDFCFILLIFSQEKRQVQNTHKHKAHPHAGKHTLAVYVYP